MEDSTHEEIKNDPLLQLVKEAKNGDMQSLYALWASVEKFIKWQAQRRFTLTGTVGGAEVSDLIQTGFIALCGAIEHYDCSGEKGSFLTLLGYYLLSEFAKCQGLKKRNPVDYATSLDEPINDDGSDGKQTTRADLVPDPAAQADFDSVEDAIFQAQLKKALQAAIDRLPPIRREVIKNRFFDGLTQKEIALKRNITPGAVQAAEGEALRQLRREACKTGLEQFVAEHTTYFYHYGVATMEHTGTSPVEASVLQRERLEKLWESQRGYTIIT